MISTNKNLKKLNLTFNYNLKREVDVFFILTKDKNFIGDKINKIFEKYPNLLDYKNNAYKDKAEIKNFVENEYHKNSIIIENLVKKLNKRWEEKKEKFIILSNNIFKYKFPDLIYDAQPSIWPLYIRDFRNKLITFPLNDGVENAILVICHELLHVIFYDYLYKKYPQLKDKKNRRKTYEFSECLNILVQNQKDWLDIYKIKQKPSQEISKLYSKMEKKWEKEKDLDILIKEFLLK